MAERIHIKSPGEVAKMQKAGAVTAEILMEIGAEVQVGRTTREIDDIAREIFKKHKVGNSFYQYRGFPASSAFPSMRKWCTAALVPAAFRTGIL